MKHITSIVVTVKNDHPSVAEIKKGDIRMVYVLGVEGGHFRVDSVARGKKTVTFCLEPVKGDLAE